MPCSNFETAIMEYVENQLPEPQRTEVALHLSECTECRQFAQELQDLDLAFSREIKVPKLSAGFESRLAKRIQTERVAMSQAERAERKQQIEKEFRAGMQDLKRSIWALLFLDGIGLMVVGGVLGWLFWNFSKNVAATNQAQSTQLLAITAGACLTLGVIGFLSQPVRRYFTAG